MEVTEVQCTFSTEHDDRKLGNTIIDTTPYVSIMNMWSFPIMNINVRTSHEGNIK